MKRLDVRLTRRAARQIDTAAAWWTENRRAAPLALVEELAEAYELIATQPRIGSAAVRVRLRGVRRLHLTGVRYYLYYRKAGSAIEVLAFWHESRGSEPL